MNVGKRYLFKIDALKEILNLGRNDKLVIDYKYVVNSEDTGLLSLTNDLQFGLDYYCESCKDKKTFSILSKTMIESVEVITDLIRDSYSKANAQSRMNPEVYFNNCIKQRKARFDIELCCPICNSRIYFYYVISDGVLKKISSYPDSMNGLKIDYRRYKEISKGSFDYYNEFVTGLYVYNHCNSGIGSYCYLRRCIENYVNDYVVANPDVIIENNDTFEKKVKKLDGKISKDISELLKPLYKILSKGIHELDENVCLSEFDKLKQTVEIILDDKLSKIELDKKKDKLAKDLNKKSSELI